jgi:hypothetical protein
MNTKFSARLSSLEEVITEVSSRKTFKEETLSVEYKQVLKFFNIILLIVVSQDDQSNSISSSRRVSATSGSYLVDYGPIRVRHRRNASRTFATGRRSKDDPVSAEEAAKLEIRRTKNRIAARELKRSRDQIELDLIQQIKDLEEEKTHLEEQHKKLEEHRAQLNRAVYNAKQTPLIPFITDMNIPLFFERKHGRDLLIDLQPLLDAIDEDFNLFEC